VKLVLIPISIVAGLVAGKISGRIVERLWAVFSPDSPPDAKDRDIDLVKLVVAAAIQGAIFRVLKTASDQYTRRALYRTTGKWPGEKKPKDA
jgi:hypothetical protein